MNKTILDNPAAKGFKLIRIQFSQDERPTFINETGLDNPPPGYRGFARVVKGVFEYGIEPGESDKAPASTPASDKYDGMSVSDLQTQCAMRSIKYEKGDNATVLIAKLRSKS